MGEWSYLKDRNFLKSLDNYKNKTFWVKIEIYNLKDVLIRSIQGIAQPGSTISINGSSSVRRTCNISLVAEDGINDLTNIDSLLSANKRIKIFEGIKNNVDGHYDEIVWFPLGVFVVIQPSITHNSGGCLISLSCKDKMCLLNGECAGGLPTSVTFHEYDQIIGKIDVSSDPTISVENPNDYTIYCWNGKYYSWSEEYGWKQESNANSVGDVVSRPQRIYDIIQTLVCNYGGESLDKIFINDVPLSLKQVVRYVGSGTLYYNSETSLYTLNQQDVTKEGKWSEFQYNDEIGYVYTDFTYPGSLVSSIGENVASVLDKIKNTLGNYEYFYDIEGNFIFQEIKNYLNNSYDATTKYRLDNNRKVEVANNGVSIVDDTNYEVNFYSNSKSVYTFNEGNGLINSFTNSPNYSNLKNDFHIWGEGEKNGNKSVIHYHLAIKDKPSPIYKAGEIVSEQEQAKGYISNCENDQFNSYDVVYVKNSKNEETGGIRLATSADDASIVKKYVPQDWRAELYLQGLSKQQVQQRPDIYEQELLNLFDAIYNFRDKTFKTNLVNSPNNLNYFFDYLEPIDKLYDCSVDVLNTKVYSYQQNKIKKLYNVDVPNVVLIDLDLDDASREQKIERCEDEGQSWSNVEHVIYSKVAIGASGYTAQEVARDLIYQYTNYNETISITSIPIYYLDVNSRITVQDIKSNIYGDYIIHNITLPLDAGSTMAISASRALERF